MNTMQRRIRGRGWVRLLTALALTASFQASALTAQTIDFPNFDSTDGLTLNGAAAASGGVLRLVPEVMGQAGTAFWETALATDQGFESEFQFQITGAQPIELLSDGLALVIHSDPRADTALGFGGGALGYSDIAPNGQAISPSVVIEFDIYQNGWDPDDHHVALTLDGDKTNHVVAVATDQPIDNGLVKNVLVTYDAMSNQLSVSYSEDGMPVQLLFSESVDLQDMLGDSAYFGFSASTGGGFANHDLLNWSLETDCSSLAVLGSGLPGSMVTFELTGGTPFASTYLLVSGAQGVFELSVAPLGFVTLGVLPPWIPLPLGITDANGDATLSVQLPASPLAPIRLYAQAVSTEIQDPLALAYCTSDVVMFKVGDF